MKYKLTLLWVLKIAVIILSLFFIYQKLSTNELLSLGDFYGQFKFIIHQNTSLFILILLLTDLNWFCEVYKWKELVSFEKDISIYESYQQTLAAHSISIFTPFKTGDYGFKIVSNEKSLRKKLLILNLVNNGYQLIVTLLFGLAGIMLLNAKIFELFSAINFTNIGVFVVVISFITFFIIFTRKKIGRNTYLYFKSIPLNTHLKVISLSLLKYVAFSTQFYLILSVFILDISYYSVAPILFCMYVFASFIPIMSLFDWSVKGTIGSLLFAKFLNLKTFPIVTTSVIMWFLNMGLPAVIGLFFIAQFKPKE